MSTVLREKNMKNQCNKLFIIYNIHKIKINWIWNILFFVKRIWRIHKQVRFIFIYTITNSIVDRSKNSALDGSNDGKEERVLVGGGYGNLEGTLDGWENGIWEGSEGGISNG